MGPQHPLECDRQQERHEYLFLLYMSINSKDSNAANNSNGSPDKPGGLSIQLCKSEKKEFYIRYSS